MRRLRRALLFAPVAMVLAACGASNTSPPPTTTPVGAAPSARASRGSGPVDVLYAGSLLDLMDNRIGPSFDKATGYKFVGVSGDSGSLANEIKGKTIQGDVFISANPSKDALVEGAANGNWASWYATFGTSPLVLGYDPSSKFAQSLKTQPWYEVVDQPGFLLGRTDPSTDPKGVLAVTALDNAASAHNLPALARLAKDSSIVYPEATLVGRLQAGQLDAGFFYEVEAAAAHLQTAPVPSSTPLQAVYTVTVLNHAPHQAGAMAFVRYLLGASGSAALGQNGIDPTGPPAVTGTPPSSLQGVFSGP